LVLGAVLGSVLGCPLELQRGVSCGDGWWDPEFEECDPRDVDAPYIDACRDRGILVDAECDPQTCTIRASEEDCQCRLDPSACAQVCGDGQVLGHEECDPEFEQGGFKSPECRDYKSNGSIHGKHYADGMVGPCNENNCTFGRLGCNFCGDGVQDGAYTDWIAPTGTATFLAEVCDGAEVEKQALQEHCVELCLGADEQINGDVVLHCDFECADDCSGVAPPDDVILVPGQDPAAHDCCLAQGSPCPTGLDENVPDLPCCSWLPSTQGTCVEKQTNSGDWVCP
jgi:hypothetical protein